MSVVHTAALSSIALGFKGITCVLSLSTLLLCLLLLISSFVFLDCACVQAHSRITGILK